MVPVHPSVRPLMVMWDRIHLGWAGWPTSFEAVEEATEMSTNTNVNVAEYFPCHIIVSTLSHYPPHVQYSPGAL